MTFLHLAMLAGLAAVAVPILIHLLWRHRPRTVAWGAMFLIEEVLRDTSRRIALEQRALLAMRCLIMLLLALALARPVLTGWRPLTGTTPVALALVIDDSPSMKATTPDGPSAFDTAKLAADRILEDLPQSSSVQLVTSTTVDDKPLTPAAARQRLRNVAPAASAFDLQEALHAAGEALEEATHSQRQVIVLSDFQATAIPHDLEALKNQPLPEVSLLPIPLASTANIAVERVSVSPRRPEPGSTARIVVGIRNFGDIPARDLPVSLRVEGQERDEQRVDVPAQSVASATFLHIFSEAGPVGVEVTIEPESEIDELPEDDLLRVGLDISGPAPVLIVNGGDGGLPFGQNPADFLELALSSEADESEGESVRVVAANELSIADLGEVSTLILANVESLGEGQASHVRNFVEAGGVLLVWPGEAADIAWYNGWSLLPATLSDLQVRPASITLQGPPYAHPALALWRDEAGSLTQVEVQTHYTLQPREGAAVVLRLADGTPVAVEHPVGRGTAMLFSIPATPGWSDLPLRPAFLPLVRQLIDHSVAAAALPRTLVTGQRLSLLATPTQAATFRLRTPGGRPAALSQTLDNGTTLLRSHLKTTPGFYEIVDAQGERQAVFGVNLDPAESDLETVPISHLETFAEALDAILLTSADDFARRDRERRFGTDLVRPALLILGLLLVLEPFLAALLSGVRNARLLPLRSRGARQRGMS